MSYRCKTCNKELEDYILVCDNCGTKKPSIKIQETKKEVTEEEKKEVEEIKTGFIDRLIISVIILLIHAGIIVYGIYNFTTLGSLILYILGAYALVFISRYVFPKNILIRVIFSIETYIFFGIILLPLEYLLDIRIDK